MDGQLKLSSLTVEQIARRVVALLREEAPAAAPGRYVDAATLALDLGVERDWVYSHAHELGAIRLGGPRGRLRFDLVGVKQRLEAGELAQVSLSRTSRPGRDPRKANHQHRPKRGIESPQIQRPASAGTPARSPKQHQTGGSPE